MSNRTKAAIAGKSKEEIIEILKKEARDGWPGKVGEERAQELDTFVRSMITNYSKALGYTEEEILQKIEGNRDYMAINYYQEANFPSLDGIEVFETVEQFKARFPAKQFICPACKGISTNPQTCNSGKNMSANKVCDWKSWGLFRTMGEGYRFVIKEDFLDRPVVHEIFKPIELTKKDTVEVES